VADNTERDALPLTAGDVGKFVRVGVAAPYLFYVLQDHAVPVWGALGGIFDHGGLTGLADDDHVQYLPVSGARDMTGQLRGIAGSTVVPTFSFGSETNSGLYHPGAGVVGVSVAGAERARFAAAESQLSTHWIPDVTLTRDLGRTDRRWRTLYVDSIVSTTPIGGVSDHGALTGLADDDHAQYLLISGTRPMNGPLQLTAGTITAPSLTFSGDTNTGAFQPSADIFGIATAGEERVRFTATSSTLTGNWLPATDLTHDLGSALLRWNNLYVNSITSTVPVDHGGLGGLGDDDHTQYLLIAGTRAMTGPLQLTNGTEAAPSLTFASETGADTGLYRPGAGILGVTADGLEVARFQAPSGANPQAILPVGSALRPSLRWGSTESGFYSQASRVIFTFEGTSVWALGANGFYGTRTGLSAVSTEAAGSRLLLAGRQSLAADNNPSVRIAQYADSPFIGASVSQKLLQLQATLNQTGTSSFTALEVDITETAVGSGVQRLIDARTGGTSRFAVTNTGLVQAADGAVGSPSFSFLSDPTAGVYRIGAGIVGIGTAGTERVRFTAADSTLTGNWLPAADITYNLGSPSFRWNNIYVNSIISTTPVDHGGLGGLGDDDHTQYLLISGTRAMTGALQLISGTASVPALTFSAETNMGLYRGGAGTISMAIAGAQAWSFSDGLLIGHAAISEVRSTSAIESQLYLAGRGTTGAGPFLRLYNQGSLTASSGVQYLAGIQATLNQTGTAGFTALDIDVTETAVGSGAQRLFAARVGGVARFAVANTGQVLASDGSAAAPIYSFAAQSNTGIYRSGTSTLAMSFAGTAGWTFGAGLLIGQAVTTNTIRTTGSFTASLELAGGHTTNTTPTVRLYNHQTYTAASGNQTLVGIDATVNQAASTASFTALDINITETSLGSGTQRLIAARTGGTTRFAVTNTGLAQAGDGSAAAPSLSFLSDPTAGMYRVSSGIVGIGTAGVERVRFTATDSTLTGNWLPAADLTYDLGAPAQRWNNLYVNSITSTTPIDHGGLGGLGDDDHTQYLLVSGTRAMSGALTLVDGTAATPGVRFASATNTGFFLSGGAIRWSITGTERGLLGTSLLWLHNSDFPISVNTANRGVTITGNYTTTAAGASIILGNTGSYTASTGVQTVARVTGTLNQTSTAGYTGLEIAITETATGSGTKRLLDAKVGGATLAYIDNAGRIGVPVGSAATPSIHFTADTTLGIFQSAASTIGFVTAANTRMTVGTLEVTTSVPIRASAGSALEPAFSFTAENSLGMYRVGAQQLGFSVTSVRFTISNANITSTLPILAPDGAVGAPAYSFTSDTGLGLYRSADDTLGVSANGVLQLTIDTAATTTTGRFSAPTGITLANCKYSFNGFADHGIIHPGTSDNGPTIIANEFSIAQFLSPGAKAPLNTTHAGMAMYGGNNAWNSANVLANVLYTKNIPKAWVKCYGVTPDDGFAITSVVASGSAAIVTFAHAASGQYHQAILATGSGSTTTTGFYMSVVNASANSCNVYGWVWSGSAVVQRNITSGVDWALVRYGRITTVGDP
jgi:hypothetical protein